MKPTIFRGLKSRLKNTCGFSLIELLIAVTLFVIGFGGILMTNTRAKQYAVNSVVTFAALHYSQALLECVQSYPYEEPDFDTVTPTPASIFTLHDCTFSAFDATDSGIYNASDNLVRKLPEEGISLQYYPTSLPASPTPLNPFQRASSISDIKYVMGPDEGDLNGAAGFGPATGKYRINQDQYDKNIFGFNISGHSGKDLVSRYYFMDDVDDFDGFREEREIYPGIIATFYISVMGVYGNQDNYSVTYDDTGGNPVTKTITQNRYDIMQPIALEGTTPNITLCGINFSDAGNPTDAAQENGTAYYMQTLFKKVTVKATWEFPPGSGTIKTIVLDGGRVNPEATA